LVHRLPLERERGVGLLYVALAMFGALLTSWALARSSKPRITATFRKLTDDYWCLEQRQSGQSREVLRQEQVSFFYDLAPFSYHSWKEYRGGVQKEFFDNAAAASLTLAKTLKVTRRGTIADTVPMHLSRKTKDAKSTEADIRYTGIWESAARIGCLYTNIFPCLCLVVVFIETFKRSWRTICRAPLKKAWSPGAGSEQSTGDEKNFVWKSKMFHNVRYYWIVARATAFSPGRARICAEI